MSADMFLLYGTLFNLEQVRIHIIGCKQLSSRHEYCQLILIVSRVDLVLRHILNALAQD